MEAEGDWLWGAARQHKDGEENGSTGEDIWRKPRRGRKGNGRENGGSINKKKRKQGARGKDGRKGKWADKIKRTMEDCEKNMWKNSKNEVTMEWKTKNKKETK